MKFYTSASQWGNHILTRGYSDGKPWIRREDFTPSLFVHSKNETEYKTLDGRSLDRMVFGSINEGKEFVKRYEETHGFQFFGNTKFNYQWISENTTGEVKYDFDQLRILSIDIETEVEAGFPNCFDPQEKVILICIKPLGKTAIIFGTTQYPKKDYRFKYVYCANEQDLFLKFIDYWSSDYPDIVTGWNTDGFDFPYLYARITKILSGNMINKLSPFDIVTAEDRVFNNERQLNINILGISSLDYLLLYKKFANTPQENYKLDTIAMEELGHSKLENPFETFKEWYTNDNDSFVEYNFVDAELIEQLEEKRNLIKLAVSMAYTAKINFKEVFSPVRTWDTLIYNYLYDKNIIVPQPERTKGDDTIEGAYVKEPIPGLYDWVVSFDLNSLYPHIIMALNMSPETILDVTDITVNKLLDGDISGVKPGYSFAGNGSMYNMSKSGFLPELMHKLYDGRKKEKNLMLSYESQLEAEKPTASPERIKELESLVSTKDSLQNAMKVLMNSGYGALANRGFRFFDQRLAEGITKTGQLVIQTAERNANEYISKITGLEKDYVIASDTDSLYIYLDVMVNKFCKDKSKLQKIEFLEKACSDKIVPNLNSKFDNLCDALNWRKDLLVFKLEVVADRGYWSAKKKYALNVYSSEGVRYESPKLKIKGLQIVQSSTPGVVRKYLKKSVEMLLLQTEEDLQTYVKEVEKEFYTLSAEQMAFPRSANNLKQYSSKTSIYGGKTPIAVRGVLLYNHYIDQHKLGKKYAKISEGEKVKFIYLKMPNHIREDVISFNTKLPLEFNLHDSVDTRKMFEKTYLQPLDKLLEHAGWHTEQQATLEGLFE